MPISLQILRISVYKIIKYNYISNAPSIRISAYSILIRLRRILGYKNN